MKDRLRAVQTWIDSREETRYMMLDDGSIWYYDYVTQTYQKVCEPLPMCELKNDGLQQSTSSD